MERRLETIKIRRETGRENSERGKFVKLSAMKIS